MRYSIKQGIFDNDPEGTTGVGTVFCLEVFDTIKAVKVHTRLYGLLDVVEGRFDPQKELSPWVQENKEAEKKFLQERCEKQQQAKQERQQRHKDTAIDPKTINQIHEQLKDAGPLVQQYLAGNEKALNALVGRVVKAFKQLGVNMDPAVISTVLKHSILTTGQKSGKN